MHPEGLPIPSNGELSPSISGAQLSPHLWNLPMRCVSLPAMKKMQVSQRKHRKHTTIPETDPPLPSLNAPNKATYPRLRAIHPIPSNVGHVGTMRTAIR